jgi:aerobic carbon-monoxide dehydrogenase medium subunit
MLVSVSYPVAAAGEVSAFRMFNQRHGDFAIVAVAACLRVEQGRAARLAIGIGGVGPVPQRLEDVARAHEGRRVSPDWIAEVARAAREAVRPEENPRVPAVFRQELTETLVARALAGCAEKTGAPA